MHKKSIIIIGGGIAGLVAAAELSSRFEVILLEALSVFGGRIMTLNEPGFAQPIEGGAEFVHGAAAETLRLLQNAKIGYSKVEGAFYRLQQNGRLKKEEGQVEGWDTLMEKMSEATPDTSLQQFLDHHFRGDRFQLLRGQAITFAEGFDLADINTVSVKSLYEEWSHQSEDHRVDGGYKRLIDYLTDDCLKKGCKLILDEQVKDIRWSEGNVQLFTQDLFKFEADKCLITVPLGVLQNTGGSMALNFFPPITSYLSALRKIGFGTVVKIILSFKECFWEKDAGFFFSEEEIPTWWTQLPSDVPILTGWAGGPKGATLSACTDEQLLEIALISLAGIFDKTIPELKEKLSAYHIFNWMQRGTSSGAYSYATTDSTASVLTYLNTPINDTIYFAGEGLYEGLHPGTVEAAIVNSLAVAKRIN